MGWKIDLRHQIDTKYLISIKLDTFKFSTQNFWGKEVFCCFRGEKLSECVLFWHAPSNYHLLELERPFLRDWRKFEKWPIFDSEMTVKLKNIVIIVKLNSFGPEIDVFVIIQCIHRGKRVAVIKGAISRKIGKKRQKKRFLARVKNRRDWGVGGSMQWPPEARGNGSRSRRSRRRSEAGAAEGRDSPSELTAKPCEGGRRAPNDGKRSAAGRPRREVRRRRRREIFLGKGCFRYVWERK